MPWSSSRPQGGKTAAKYRTKEHRDARAAHMAALKAAGVGRCAELVCIYRSRVITPAMQLHLCHERRTGAVLGLGHAACNTSEAARWARLRQESTRVGL